PLPPLHLHSVPTRRSSDLHSARRRHRSSGASGADSVSSQMIWLTLVFASLLSVAGQLCQKQATCFVAINKRRKHIVLWLGLALADRKSTRLNSSHVSISYA